MSCTFSNSLGKSLFDSTMNLRKNSKARGARRRVITIKTRLSASQFGKVLVNFFFFFAQRNILKQDEQNDVGQKKLTHFDILFAVFENVLIYAYRTAHHAHAEFAKSENIQMRCIAHNLGLQASPHIHSAGR